jgi:hypothetical protein
MNNRVFPHKNKKFPLKKYRLGRKKPMGLYRKYCAYTENTVIKLIFNLNYIKGEKLYFITIN